MGSKSSFRRFQAIAYGCFQGAVSKAHDVVMVTEPNSTAIS